MYKWIIGIKEVHVSNVLVASAPGRIHRNRFKFDEFNSTKTSARIGLPIEI